MLFPLKTQMARHSASLCEVIPHQKGIFNLFSMKWIFIYNFLAWFTHIIFGILRSGYCLRRFTPFILCLFSWIGQLIKTTLMQKNMNKMRIIWELLRFTCGGLQCKTRNCILFKTENILLNSPLLFCIYIIYISKNIFIIYNI